MVRIFTLGVISITLCISCVVSDPGQLIAFSTGGIAACFLRPATVNESGEHAIVAAAFEGTVLCCASDGKPVWEKKVNDSFPIDLAVADIGNDDLNEVFVATARDTVDASSADGTHLCSFSSKAPLYQMCPVKTGSGKWKILTGGIEETVFALSSIGKSELAASLFTRSLALEGLGKKKEADNMRSKAFKFNPLVEIRAFRPQRSGY